jgi:hypothetical protein
MNALDQAITMLRKQLRDIEAEERTLAKAKLRVRKALDALGADHVRGRSEPKATKAKADHPGAQRALAVIEPGETVTTAEVVDRLDTDSYNSSATNVNSVRANLSALHSAGHLERPKRGVYHRAAPPA